MEVMINLSVQITKKEKKKCGYLVLVLQGWV